MKKVVLAAVLMIGCAAVVVMPSCNKKSDKTYNCTCSNTNFVGQNGLSEADKTKYVTDCASSAVPRGSGAQPMGNGHTATCN
jgi:hypothetical protein